MAASYPELFTAFRIRHMELRNRVVSPPMYQVRPILSPEGLAWHRRLAAGGAGMVIVEGTSVRRLARQKPQELRPLVQTIHAEGAAAGIQLFPALPDEADGPDSLTGEQVETLIEQFGRAARTCRDAGFDAVEPHGAHGFPLNQFFMPNRNHRTDRFGGSLDNRCRLAEQIVRRIRHEAGDGLVMLYRHTPVGAEYSLEDSFVLAERLIAAGTDVLDISPARDKEVADLAAEFKRRLAVPVIAVGHMEKPELAAEALREGRCDLVAVGRQLIADAQWPHKVRDGRLDEIVWCTQCDKGCFGSIHDGKPAACVLWDEDELERYVR